MKTKLNHLAAYGVLAISIFNVQLSTSHAQVSRSSTAVTSTF